MMASAVAAKSTVDPELVSVTQLLKSLDRASKNVRTFGHQNSVAKKFFDQFYTELTNHVERYNALTFIIQREGLYFKDTSVYNSQAGESSENFAFKLYSDGIRELTFQQGIEQGDVMFFFDALWNTSGTAGTEDDDIVGMVERESSAMPLSLFEREALISDVINELFGLGPLEVLLRDPSISDILVNRYNQVYIEREGKLEETDIVFKDDRHLMQIIERIVSSVGRRIDESSPMVDARLADGSRVNAIIPPLALDGPAMSIRRFRTDRLGAQDLVARESWTEPMLEFLQAAIACRLNLIVSGGTGAGKTTLLNMLSSFIGSDGARRHDRRRRGVGAAAAPRRPAGNAARQHRRQGRRPRARAGGQRAAYAARSHHRRRGPQRRSARHAAGHEHRPRRQSDDRPRQHPARRALPPRHDGRDGEPEHSRSGRSASRSRRPSTSSCRSRAWPTARAR